MSEDNYIPFSVRYKTEKPGIRYLETSKGFITYRLDKATDTACVLELYVSPDYRGQGYGKELMHKIREEAKELGISTFMTTIDPQEETAAALRVIFSQLDLVRHAEPVKLEFELYSQRIS